MTNEPRSPNVLSLVTQIVSAHVVINAVTVSDMPKLISDVYTALARLGSERETEERPAPAVPIKKSITSDYLICLEDGKKLKMLKRHLRTAFGMTTAEYRERWGLSEDYPMVAPNYAAVRSALAKKIGLGKKRGPKRKRRK